MRIVDIRETTGAIRSDLRNAYIDFSQMTVSLLAIVTDAVRDGAPVVGYGFNSNGRYAQGGILRERLIPRILAADPAALVDETGENLDAEKVWACMMTNEKPGGHGERAMAVAALDMAVWDIIAKVAEVPLWRLLSTRHNGGAFDESVMIYPGGGYYYPGKGLDKLRDEVRAYRDQGYTLVKMKIGAARQSDDLARIEAALEVVGDGANLAVDANGKFDLETAVAFGEAIAPYGLAWYEEPGDPMDHALQAELGRLYGGAMATGENLFSRQETRNLLLYGGMRADRDWIQVDPALAYGLTEYLRIIPMIEDLGWSRRRLIPHGGHQLALNMAAGLQLGGAETYPLVFQPYGGFADDAVVVDGHTRTHEVPGIGIELKAALYRELSSLTND